MMDAYSQIESYIAAAQAALEDARIAGLAQVGIEEVGAGPALMAKANHAETEAVTRMRRALEAALELVKPTPVSMQKATVKGRRRRPPAFGEVREQNVVIGD